MNAKANTTSVARIATSNVTPITYTAATGSETYKTSSANCAFVRCTNTSRNRSFLLVPLIPRRFKSALIIKFTSFILCAVGRSAIRSAQLKTNNSSLRIGLQTKRRSISNGVTTKGRGQNSHHPTSRWSAPENNAHCTRGDGSIVLKNRQDGINIGKIKRNVFNITSVATARRLRQVKSVPSRTTASTCYVIT